MKKSYHCPRPKTIVHYLLPLANQFLCSQKYSAKNSLVDAAIDVRFIDALMHYLTDLTKNIFTLIIFYNYHFNFIGCYYNESHTSVATI